MPEVQEYRKNMMWLSLVQHGPNETLAMSPPPWNEEPRVTEGLVTMAVTYGATESACIEEDIHRIIDTDHGREGEASATRRWEGC